MAADADAIDALLIYLGTLEVQSPPLAIAMPDVAFEPVADVPYLSATLLQNAPKFQGLASGRLDQGLLQVDVVWPKGQGVVKASEVADAVIAHFPVALRIDGKVKIAGQPWKASPITEAGWTRTPVTIPWSA